MTETAVNRDCERVAGSYTNSPRFYLRQVHTRLPGRARFLIAMLYRSDRMKGRLEAGLSAIAGIKFVKGNVLTGNLLVLFNQDRSADDIAALILEQLEKDAPPVLTQDARPHIKPHAGPGDEQLVVRLQAAPVGLVGPASLFYVPLSFLGSFTLGLLQMSPILIFLTLSVVLMGQIVGKNEGWSRGDALYFSFVTATTVGYGDLRPTKTSSKALAVGISFVGLVFTGIVAAIGLHSAQHAFEGTQNLAQL